MARYNKIYAGPTRDPLPQVKEKLASVDLLPGSIAELSGDEFSPHSTAGGRGYCFVVQDNYLAMLGTDDVTPSGDRALGLIPVDEQFFNVRVSTGNDVTEGDPLSSLGDGTLGIAGATSGDEVLFYAEESYNNDTGEAQLVRARKASGTMPSA